MCPRASQWNRSHSDTCQRTFMHVLNIDDAGHADFVGAHVSECFHTIGHMCADKSLDTEVAW